MLQFNLNHDTMATCVGLKYVQGRGKPPPLLQMQDKTCMKVPLRLHNVRVKIVSAYW
jgi:hypothetical protein